MAEEEKEGKIEMQRQRKHIEWRNFMFLKYVFGFAVMFPFIGR